MKIIEVKGNLFNTTDYTNEQVMFAHCIASDFGMGAGIATQFIEHFDMKNKLKLWSKENAVPIESHQYNKMTFSYRPTLVGAAVRIENTYNLITKPFTYEKPTMYNLMKSLHHMSAQMIDNDEKFLAIPDMIGCGIDGLERSHVLNAIKGMFDVTDITIYVVKYNPLS